MALDVSLSMPAHDYWTVAHREALVLVEQLQDPESHHQLKGVIAFSEVPRSIEPTELTTLGWDYSYGSNIAGALHLALTQLDGEPGRVVLFSDMEATAHTTDQGEAFFSYPPVPETAEKTVRAVGDCHALGAQLEIRWYHDEHKQDNAGVNALLREITRLGGVVSEVVIGSS